ncbi:hypothetical protein [Paenibacillus sophorae]|uniref:Uncharacterized protein n=1 Tax=Paenibacillus sophorae TaxID=1333845 RepID=A0ABX8HGI7_9BACL|nr:hypothetical protein [Paenibacillus sophorae]QWU15845.1 hypothetical protein KP014_00720 [Paenibacillus sophorae]
MKEQRGRLVSRNRQHSPANLQVFSVNFARKKEMDARVQLFNAYTPKWGEGGQNACAFAGMDSGRGFLREIDVQMH